MWANMFSTKANSKKAGIKILVSQKLDFKQNKNLKDKVANFIKLKATIFSEDIHTNNLSPNLRRCEKRSTEIHSRRIQYVSLNKRLSK